MKELVTSDEIGPISDRKSIGFSGLFQQKPIERDGREAFDEGITREAQIVIRGQHYGGVTARSLLSVCEGIILEG